MQTSPTIGQASSGKASHTPGPWAWDESGNYLCPVDGDPSKSSVHTILSPDGTYGYLGSDFKKTQGEGEANRALIAAAPDLLDALVAVVASLQAHLRHSANPGLDSIRLGIAGTAIEKAMGVDVGSVLIRRAA